MKICLIYPYVDEIVGSSWPSLGLAYVAAALEQKNHSIKLIDRNILSSKNQDIDKVTIGILKELKPELVGITVTTPMLPDSFHVSKIVKEILPNTKVIYGGHHPTILYREVLSNKNVDIVVLGEGEVTICEIAEGKQLKDIPGIAYKEEDKIMVTESRNLVKDIDSLPMPAWHHYDMEYYARYSEYNNPVIRGVSSRATHIFAARGCPYRCSFCSGPVIFGNRVRFHSVNRVIEEIEFLIEHYGINGIYLAEDMFLSKREHVEMLCDEFIKRKLNKKIVWCAQCRSDRINKELLIMMKKAGCIQIEYGFESGSQRILNMMSKKTTPEQNILAANLTKKIGLRFLANIIIGFPGETKEDFIDTIEFLKRIKPTEIGFNILTPLPGTRVYNDLISSGIITEVDWSDFYVASKKLNFTTMTNDEFFSLYEDFIKKVVNPNRLLSYYSYNILHNPKVIGYNLLRRTLVDPIGTIKKISSHGSDIAKRLYERAINNKR